MVDVGSQCPINAYHQPLDEVAWMSTFGMAIVGHGMHVINGAAASCEVPRARDTEFEEIVVETMETERLACDNGAPQRFFLAVAICCHFISFFGGHCMSLPDVFF